MQFEGPYLTPEIPFGIYSVVYSLGLECLGSNSENDVRVRLALTQQAYILLHQMLGFHYMHPEHPLLTQPQFSRHSYIKSQNLFP